MALKPKAIITTLDEERLYPITKASNVILQNGENAQTVVGDRVEDMFSPVLKKTNTSIFNSGLGDNNDYSLNVVNSAYNSCVLNGQSFANLQHNFVLSFKSGLNSSQFEFPESFIHENAFLTDTTSNAFFGVFPPPKSLFPILFTII